MDLLLGQKKSLLETINDLRHNTRNYTLIKLLCEIALCNNDQKNNHQFWDNYAIALYYLGLPDLAYLCYKQIFSYQKTSLREHDILHYINNLKYSIPKNTKENHLHVLQKKTLMYLNDKINTDPGFVPFNPSIVRHNGGYILSIRSSNDKLDKNFNHVVYECESRNLIVHLDKDFKVINTKKLTHIPMEHRLKIWSGWEDIRLFFYKNQLHCMFVSVETKYLNHQQICISNLEYETPSYTLLDGYGANQKQKNWVPIVKNDNLFFIYSFYPLIVLKYDDGSKNVSPHQVSIPKYHNAWRGGSIGVPLDSLGYSNFYLSVVHESAFPKYVHRFVLLRESNDIFEIYNYSNIFCFFDNIVEFCAGLTISVDKKDFVLTFGKMDQEAYLTTIDIKKTLDELFSIIQ